MRRTKIVCTLGPATSTREQIQEFIERSFKEAAEYTSKILDELDLDM